MNEYDKNELKVYLQNYCDSVLERTNKPYFYICPFCRSGTGKNHTPAFHLFRDPDGIPRFYKCHSCGQSGDLYSLISHIENLTFSQSLDRAMELFGNGKDLPKLSRMVEIPKREKIVRLEPEQPSKEWQRALMPIVRRARDVIFEDAGIKALEYLHRRGIDDYTIRAHKIGYIPPVKADEWNLENGYSFSIPSPFPTDDRKHIAIPTGITFPYIMDEHLYKLETRRLPDQEETAGKIGQVRGSKPALFNADDATCSDRRRDILFTEGVIDALSINQTVGRWCDDEIKAVSFGSATARSDPDEFYKWYVMPYRVIVGFDNDDTGREYGAKLALDITRARTDAGRNKANIAFPPERYKDWNEFLVNEPESVFEYVAKLFPETETKG